MMNTSFLEMLPAKYRNIVKEILKRVELLCCRAYLFGSWSEGLGNDLSDVDLLLIVHDSKQFNRVMNILEKYEESYYENRPLIDTKVYTEEQLRDALSSLNHFKLWSGLNSGVLLWGEPEYPKLRIDLLRKIMMNWLNRINDVSIKIDMHSEFKGSCYVLYSALVEFFFIEKHLLPSSNTLNKKEIISAHFNGFERMVRKEFYSVANRAIKQPSQSKITTRSKKRRLKSEFLKLADAAKTIEKYCDKIYREVTSLYCDSG